MNDRNANDIAAAIPATAPPLHAQLATCARWLADRLGFHWIGAGWGDGDAGGVWRKYLCAVQTTGTCPACGMGAYTYLKKDPAGWPLGIIVASTGGCDWEPMLAPLRDEWCGEVVA